MGEGRGSIAQGQHGWWPFGQHLWGRRVLGSVGAQAPSAVILEPSKIKSDTVSTVSPSISHEVMGPEAMIFVFWMYLKQTNKSSIQIFSRKKMIFSSNMLSRLCSWAGRIWREFYFCISYFCIKSSQICSSESLRDINLKSYYLCARKEVNKLFILSNNKNYTPENLRSEKPNQTNTQHLAQVKL